MYTRKQPNRRTQTQDRKCRNKALIRQLAQVNRFPATWQVRCQAPRCFADLLDFR